MRDVEEKTIFDKLVKITKGFFISATCLVLAFLLIGGMVFPDERDVVTTQCRLFEATWQQVLENGEKIPAEVPGAINASEGETVTLVTNVPEGIRNGENLCFRTIWQNVDIYVGEEHRNHMIHQTPDPLERTVPCVTFFLSLAKKMQVRRLLISFPAIQSMPVIYNRFLSVTEPVFGFIFWDNPVLEQYFRSSY